MSRSVRHLDPPGLPSNPGFSLGVAVDGAARTIYVGGQNAVEPDGTIVDGDIGRQTTRALQNLELVLAEAGAGLEDIVMWSVLVVAGQPLPPAFAAFQEAWGTRGRPPAITVAYVTGLVRPEFLIEISAIAVGGSP